MGGGTENNSTTDGVNLSVDDATYEALDKEFQDVLNEMVDDDDRLKKFRIEYEKLLQTFHTTHENERRLLNKCRELYAEVAANDSRVAAIQKRSEEDKATIESLKKDVEKALKMVEITQKKEQKARETAQSLKAEIVNMTRSGEVKGAEQSDERKLQKIREQLMLERDTLLVEVNNLNQEIASHVEDIQNLEVKLDDRNATIEKLELDLQVCKSEVQKETKKRERIDREFLQVRMDNRMKDARIKTLEEQEQKAEEIITKLKLELKEQKEIQEKNQIEFEAMSIQFQNLQNDFDSQIIKVKHLTAENNKNTLDLRAQEEEIDNLKEEVLFVSRIKEVTARKVRSLETKDQAKEQKISEQKKFITNLEKEMTSTRKQAGDNQKRVAEMRREIELLAKNLLNTETVAMEYLNQSKMHEKTKQNLEQEITSHKIEVAKQSKIISHLERERDKFVNEAGELAKKIQELLNEIHIHENQAFDSKKQLTEINSQLKQLKNLYEAACSDRYTYSKYFKEAQDTVSEQKEKVDVLNHYIDQLKEELRERDVEIAQVQQEKHKLLEERRALREDVQKQKEDKAIVHKELKHREQFSQRLEKSVVEKEQEIGQLHRDLNEVTEDRNILGTQLLRRNDELTLLYERMRLQEIAITRGEHQYKQRIDDIKLLKKEVINLSREKKLLAHSANRMERMRRELIKVQRELLREEMKCKALEQELQKPMNVHRWRILGGSDPDKYELIQKTQVLQRRLGEKSQEVSDRDLIIKEKDKLIGELRKLLTRQPSPEIAQQLQLCRKQLRDKTQQLKSLVSQVNMFESCVTEYKSEIERLTCELREAKRSVYNFQKRDQLAKERKKVESELLVMDSMMNVDKKI